LSKGRKKGKFNQTLPIPEKYEFFNYRETTTRDSPSDAEVESSDGPDSAFEDAENQFTLVTLIIRPVRLSVNLDQENDQQDSDANEELSQPESENNNSEEELEIPEDQNNCSEESEKSEESDGSDTNSASEDPELEEEMAGAVVIHHELFPKYTQPELSRQELEIF